MSTKRLTAATIAAAAFLGSLAGVAPAALAEGNGADGAADDSWAFASMQTETISTPSSRAAEGGTKWHFTIPLGIWPFGITGPCGVSGYETDVDMSISDVQDFTQRALGFSFEAGRDKITGLAQVAFLRFEPDRAWATLPNGVAVYGNPRLDWITAELAVAYRSTLVNPGPTMFVFEPLVGVRYSRMESSIQLKQPADTSLAERDINWTDVFAGFRATKSFTKHIGLTVRGDVGTGGSNLTWNAAGSLGYRFPFAGGSAFTLAVGYKASGLDYESDTKSEFFMDQTLSGPTVGVAYSF
jgi:hypothetical protein